MIYYKSETSAILALNLKESRLKSQPSLVVGLKAYP